MPELPEVQSVVTGLNKILPNKTIKSVEVFWQKTIATPAVETFQKKLTGLKIKEVARRAKFIVMTFESGEILLTHLRMSGQFSWHQELPSENAKHLRVRFLFTDNSVLDFMDTRKFARMYLFQNLKEAEEKALYKLGAEPLEIKALEFREIFRAKKGNIKGNLLRQDLVSGVGNIYADESLFLAKIHPTSLTHKIPKAKFTELHQVLQGILRKAIKRNGTTVNTFLNINGEAGGFRDELQVYKQEKAACPNCGNLIQKIRLGSRGTHFCATCQKKYL